MESKRTWSFTHIFCFSLKIVRSQLAATLLTRTLDARSLLKILKNVISKGIVGFYMLRFIHCRTLKLLGQKITKKALKNQINRQIFLAHVHCSQTTVTMCIKRTYLRAQLGNINTSISKSPINHFSYPLETERRRMKKEKGGGGLRWKSHTKRSQELLLI